VLVVEYKGALLAHDPSERQKRLIGELWAERSHGRCLFAWVENQQFAEIGRVIHSNRPQATSDIGAGKPR
jgi:type III restriction enzyme